MLAKTNSKYKNCGINLGIYYILNKTCATTLTDVYFQKFLHVHRDFILDVLNQHLNDILHCKNYEITSK